MDMDRHEDDAGTDTRPGRRGHEDAHTGGHTATSAKCSSYPIWGLSQNHVSSEYTGRNEIKKKTG